MTQDILITPASGEPQILFRGSGTNDTPIELNVLSSYQSASGSGTALVFEGQEGQLFAITDNLSSGVIFNVGDITGLSLLSIDASGTVKLGEFANNVITYPTATLSQGALIENYTPSTTTHTLYNDNGDLKWDGVTVISSGSSGAVQSIDGSGSPGHVAFWADSNTIDYDSGQFYWDKTNNRLGLGVTPYAPFHLKITGTPPTSASQNYFGNLVLEKTGDYWNRIRFDKNGIAQWGIASDNNDKFAISRLDSAWAGVPDDDNFVINTDGKVGIQTSSPTEILHVNGTNAGDGALIGNAKIGRWESNADYTAFTHDSIHSTHTSYALLQSILGSTYVNAATGQYLSFRINNVNSMVVEPNRSVKMLGDSTSNNWSSASPTLAIKRSNNEPYISYHNNDGTRIGYLQFKGAGDSVFNFENNYGLRFLTGGNDRLYISSAGDVGIGTTSPTEKLDVSGNIRAVGRIDASLFNEPAPGISAFSSAMDSTISYVDTGKNLPNTHFRGCVWTGKHYIFSTYLDDTIYFYDSNFEAIEDAYGRTSVTLPGNPYNPHGLAWDGRYLWTCEYPSSTLYINCYDINKSVVERVAHAQAASTSSAGLGYAEGLFYYVQNSTIYCYRHDGGDSFTQVFTSAPGFEPGFNAQAITYDGSYLWITAVNKNIYKCNLDGDIIQTISSGYPPNITGWTWNGENIVCFDYSNSDIYIIQTSQRSFMTEKVGIGTLSPTQALDVRYPVGGGMALLKSTDTTDGLLFGDMAYSTNNSYQGIKHAAMTGALDYMMISEGVNTYISAKSGGTTVIGAGGNDTNSQIQLKPNSEVVVNENSSSIDFRVESNDNANMLFVDGITNRVGIDTASPSSKLTIGTTIGTGSNINSTSGYNFGIHHSKLRITSAEDTSTNPNYPLINLLVSRPANWHGGTASIDFETRDRGNNVNRGVMARILGGNAPGTTASSPDGGYLSLDVAASGSTTPSSRIAITRDGYVGIGTTTPVFDLDVRTNSNNALYVAQGGGARYLLFGPNGFINNTTLSVSKYNWSGAATIEASTTISSRRGLLIEQVASQTANAIETRNNTGTPLSYITSAGGAYFAGDVNLGSFLRIDRDSDERGIVFEDSGGTDSIYMTVNDGQGNFNIMLGVNHDGNRISSDDGLSKILLTGHNDSGEISLNAGNIGSAGTSAVYNIGLSLDSSDQKLRIGNPNDNIGLDNGAGNIIADVDGDLITRYLRARDSNGIQIGDDSDTLGIFVKDGGNVGIGTTSPATKLDVDGPVRVNSTSAIGNASLLVGDIVNATSSAIAQFNGFLRMKGGLLIHDTTTVANTFYCEYNGSLGLRVRSTEGSGSKNILLCETGGYVGIGTSTANYLLDADQSADGSRIINVSNTNTGSGSHAGFRAESNSTLSYVFSHADARTVDRYGFALGGWSEILSQYGNGIAIGTDSSDVPIVFANNSTERMRIAAGGNVGIGTTSPEDKLHVLDGSYGAIIGAGTSTAKIVGWNTSYNSIDIRAQAGEGSQLYVSTNGNVGINETSPAAKLQVDGTIKLSDTAGNRIQFYQGGGGTNDYTIRKDGLHLNIAGVLDAGTHRHIQFGHYNGSNVWQPKVSINGYNGNTGFGTTTPSYKIDAHGESATWTQRILGANSTGNSFGLIIDAGFNSSDEALRIRNRLSTATLLEVRGDGNVGVGTASPNSTLHAYSATSGTTIFNAEGTNGSLFSVVDNLSGTLMSVNTVAGLPVLEVNSDYSVTAGRFNQNDFVITTSGDIGMGTASPNGSLHVDKSISGGNNVYFRNTNNGSGSYQSLRLGNDTALTKFIIFTNSSTRTSDGGAGNTTIRTDSGNLILGSNGSEKIKLTSTEVVVNDNSSNLDFRVESDGNANMLFVDGVSNRVGIGTGSPSYTLDVNGSINGSTIVGSSSFYSSDIAVTDTPGGSTGGMSTPQNARVTVLGGYSHNGSWIKFQKGTTFNNDSEAWIGARYNSNYGHDLLFYTSKKGNSLLSSKDSALNAYFSQDRIGLYTGSAGTGNSTERVRIDSAGNVGIGTTSPTKALVINREDEHAGIEIYKSGTGNKVAALGTGASNPLYDYGILQLYDSSTEHIRLYTKGNSWINGGNLGVGTNSPTQKLHIASSDAANLILKIEQDNANYSCYSEFNSQDGGYARFGINNNVNDHAFFNTDQASYKWYASGSEKMTLTSDGKLGIGTASPVNLLHIEGEAENNSQRYSQLYIKSAGTYPSTIAGICLDSVGSDQSHIRFMNNGTSKFQIRYNNGDATDDKLKFYSWTQASDMVTFDGTNGYVGIGTTSPSHPISVENDSNSTTYISSSNTYGGVSAGAGIITQTTYAKTYIISHGYNKSGTRYGSNLANSSELLAAGTEVANSRLLIGTAGFDKPIIFGNDDTERMRIDAGGNVGVGTDSPNAVLHAYGSTPSGTVFNVEGTNGSLFSVVDNLSGVLMSVNNNAGLPVFEVYDDDSIVAGRFAQNDFVVSSSGNVGIGTATPASKFTIKGQGHAAATFAIQRTNSATEQFMFINTEATAYTTTRGTSSGQWANVLESKNSNLMLTTHNAGGTGGTIFLDANLVGVGTTSPTSQLHVVGDLQVDNLNLNGNTIAVTNSNGILYLAGAGVGGVGIGQSVSPSGNYSAVLGGSSNTTTKDYSTTVGGLYGKTTRYGEVVHANGGFSNVPGTAQNGTVTLYGTITAGTVSELFSNGGTSINTSLVNYFKIPDSTMVNFDVQVSVISSTNNDLGGWHNARGGIISAGSPASAVLIGDLVQEYDYSSSLAGSYVTVDVSSSTDNRLRIRVGAPVNHNLWAVATIRYTQVSHGTP